MSTIASPNHLFRPAPPPILRRDSVLLFTGDSTTSADRNLQRPESLGGGYAFLIAAMLQERWVAPTLRTINRGVAGETIGQLEARFARELDEVRPTIVTILVGVNDICRRLEGKPHARPAEFVAAHRRMVNSAWERGGPDMRVILMEPFLLPFQTEIGAWREPMEELVAALREFAAGEDLPLVPLQALFNEATARAPADFWLWDGLHPTPAGCALMARAWLEHVQYG